MPRYRNRQKKRAGSTLCQSIVLLAVFILVLGFRPFVAQRIMFSWKVPVVCFFVAVILYICADGDVECSQLCGEPIENLDTTPKDQSKCRPTLLVVVGGLLLILPLLQLYSISRMHDLESTIKQDFRALRSGR